jgi:hypothetical protein
MLLRHALAAVWQMRTGTSSDQFLLRRELGVLKARIPQVGLPLMTSDDAVTPAAFFQLTVVRNVKAARATRDFVKWPRSRCHIAPRPSEL